MRKGNVIEMKPAKLLENTWKIEKGNGKFDCVNQLSIATSVMVVYYINNDTPSSFNYYYRFSKCYRCNKGYIRFDDLSFSLCKSCVNEYLSGSSDGIP